MNSSDFAFFAKCRPQNRNRSRSSGSCGSAGARSCQMSHIWNPIYEVTKEKGEPQPSPHPHSSGANRSRLFIHSYLGGGKTKASYGNSFTPLGAPFHSTLNPGTLSPPVSNGELIQHVEAATAVN